MFILAFEMTLERLLNLENLLAHRFGTFSPSLVY